ncbi:MAG: 16S rRNA (cytosine(1402)-N(4))-methyltransferase RsmH [Clostridia bacterium]|nr:16S rRNA (cytosine(1402)-N(4))-methyltransferase RsmH [Clostridia bacterium]
MEKHCFNHTPVLLNECIDGLNIKPNGIYVDGTMGGAGHSLRIVEKLKSGKLIGIDKDDTALSVCKERLKDFKNVVFVKSDFKNFKNVVENLNINGVDGILLDLGVSSHQIDTPERGFSYRFDGELDMRMDKTQSLTAFDVVNTYSEADLAKIIYLYGEENFSRSIARKIVEVRRAEPIKTTMQLKEVVESAIPKKFHGAGSPCKKTFQAIRIEVNSELDGLDTVIYDMVEKLNKGGRLAIITFHSLEDRIVKNVFKELSTNCICDKSIPVCVCNHKASVSLVNRKPIIATNTELKENKRSSSAKLRIVEKL